MKKIESHTVEFKEIWKEDNLKTLCGFANTNGGEMHVGVKDDGTVKGLPEITELIEILPNKIRTNLSIQPECQLKTTKGKRWILIRIAKSEGLVTYNGLVYARTGSNTHALRNNDLAGFVASRNSNWDTTTDSSLRFEELDQSFVKSFKKRLPKAMQKEPKLKNLLSKLHLISDNKLTRASILLFGKNPQTRYPAAYIQIGRFTSASEIVSSDRVNGTLFDQIEGSIDILVNKYLLITQEIPGVKRVETLQYPFLALREIIVNSVAHKDYSGQHIQIKVFSDRIIFWNPGELPKGLTINSIKKRHSSKPRNTLIAEMLHHARFIEKWGTGTIKIIDECKKAGLPAPIFEEVDGGFEVTLVGRQKNSLVSVDTKLKDLDSQILTLEKRIQQFDPGEEIIKQLSKEVVAEIQHGWFTQLLNATVPVIQKFNRFFINPMHSVSTPIGGWTNFADQNVETIISDLSKRLQQSQSFNPHDARFRIQTSYGSFRKAGYDTFGLNYQLEVKLMQDWYEVAMDEVVLKNNQKLQLKRLYHQPVTNAECRALAAKFGQLIHDHISEMITTIESKRLDAHE
jgi:ATP-dependent DNA helicase RecG